MGKDSGRLRQVFDLFDRNGDGEIAITELGQLLRSLGLAAQGDKLVEMMEAFVKPGRSTLQFDDFVRMASSMEDSILGEETVEPAEESDLREAFRVFDEDGDGFISARELQSVLGKLGLQEGKNMDRVHQMICSVDVNHDGRVDFQEFKLMMQEIPLGSS